MAEITFRRDPSSTTFRLKGELSGPRVDDLARTLIHTVASSPGKRVTVDLAGVSFIDSDGIELLRLLSRQGTHLRASRSVTEYIIHRVAQETRKSPNTKLSAASQRFRDSGGTKPPCALELAI